MNRVQSRIPADGRGKIENSDHTSIRSTWCLLCCRLTHLAKDKCAHSIVSELFCLVICNSYIMVSLRFLWPVLMAFCLNHVETKIPRVISCLIREIVVFWGKEEKRRCTQISSTTTVFDFRNFLFKFSELSFLLAAVFFLLDACWTHHFYRPLRKIP